MCLCLCLCISKYTRLKNFKITQFEKVCFIKVNELKLTQVELFSFFHFMCAAANASELFCMAHLANIEPFYTILTFHFKRQILNVGKLASLS